MAQYLTHSVVPNRFLEVTPSDTETLPATVVSIYVGSGGNIRVDGRGGDENVDYLAVPTGATLVGKFLRVKSTGTTAASIVAQWYQP